jgi:hypothetical protein
MWWYTPEILATQAGIVRRTAVQDWPGQKLETLYEK